MKILKFLTMATLLAACAMIPLGCGDSDDDEDVAYDIRGNWLLIYQWNPGGAADQPTFTFSGDSASSGTWTSSTGGAGTWTVSGNDVAFISNEFNAPYSGQFVDANRVEGTMMRVDMDLTGTFFMTRL